MGVTFYVNSNGQCSKTKVTGYKQADGTYKTQFEGDNKFQLMYLTPKNAVFESTNVDRTGRVTNLVFVLGKGEPLTEEEDRKFEEYVEKQNIPPENIQDVQATDTCPK
ncbi:odorant-binding protein-like [Peromyscus eremicus]|uniref:odorant-binding protein-like n=1 Tax=Peromyscus eremicus TaxID=42410 RepID=UPI0027DD1608|nr:odorant-binding protein-like [Peromyscus eremicus]